MRHFKCGSGLPLACSTSQWTMEVILEHGHTPPGLQQEQGSALMGGWACPLIPFGELITNFCIQLAQLTDGDSRSSDGRNKSKTHNNGLCGTEEGIWRDAITGLLVRKNCHRQRSVSCTYLCTPYMLTPSPTTTIAIFFNSYISCPGRRTAYNTDYSRPHIPIPNRIC